MDDFGCSSGHSPQPKPAYNPEMDPEWQKRRKAIEEKLTIWRKEMASQKGIQVWDVIKHTVLDGISRAMPVTQKELLKVRGLGELTYARYGEEILEIVKTIMQTPAENGAKDDKQDDAEMLTAGPGDRG